MLNEQQNQAVNCNDKHIVCLAGAGTGKTHTLIARINRLIDDNVDPRTILVLTFTNAASLEMKERFKRNGDSKFTPEFRTFHSFCYHLICRDANIRNALGYTAVPKIVDAGAIKRIRQKVKLQLGVKLSDEILNGDRPTDKKTAFLYDTYQKGVRRQMNAEKVISFDVLCYDVCQLFQTDSDVCKRYKKFYTNIFVDEFQDTDDRQWRFVKSFKDSNIFVVGDILQNIYSFRGSTNEIMKSLVDDPDWTCIHLVENYRSTKCICDYANGIKMNVPDNYRLKLVSKKDGPSVIERSTALPRYPQNISDVTAKDIVLRLKNYEGSTAILCRTNREVSEMIDICIDNDIQVDSSNTQNIDQELMKGAEDIQYFIDWSASHFNIEKYSDYIRLLEIVKPENKLEWFLMNFGDEAILQNYEKIKSIQALQNCSDSSGSDIAKLLKPNPSVYVGTIHSAKGLEYDNVILVNVNSKLFPLNSEDNLNLYYVGVTRARSNLLIYRCER